MKEQESPVSSAGQNLVATEPNTPDVPMSQWQWELKWQLTRRAEYLSWSFFLLYQPPHQPLWLLVRCGTEQVYLGRVASHTRTLHSIICPIWLVAEISVGSRCEGIFKDCSDINNSGGGMMRKVGGGGLKYSPPMYLDQFNSSGMVRMSSLTLAAV